MRILVCGGRDYADSPALDAALTALHRERPVTQLIHGAARGADTLAAAWARLKGVPARAFPADRRSYGRGAGFVRDLKMLRDGRPDLVVAFPGGRDTAHLVGLARSAGVEVLEVAAPRGGRP